MRYRVHDIAARVVLLRTWSSLAVLTAVVVLAACQYEGQTRPSVSLDEAKQITADFSADVAVPPRSASDILSLLEVPEPAENEFLRENRQIADAPPPEGGGWVLSDFSRRRSVAAQNVGRHEQALRDWRHAVALAGGSFGGPSLRLLRELAWLEYNAGNYRAALDAMAAALREREQSVRNQSIMAEFSRALGDVDATKHHASLSEYFEAGGCPIPCGRYNAPIRKYAVASVQGRWDEAEEFLREAIATYEIEWRSGSKGINVAEQFGPNSERALATDLADWRRQLVFNLLSQGRVVDAEFAARQALKSLIDTVGRKHIKTVRTIGAFARVLLAQGREVEAENLARISLDTLTEIGAPSGSRAVAEARQLLAKIMMATERWAQAARQFDLIRKALAGDDFLFAKWYGRDIDIPLALHRVGRDDEAIALLEATIETLTRNFRTDHPQTVKARALLAAILAKRGRTEEATTLFAATVPILLRQGATAPEDAGDNAIDQVRRRFVLESYLTLLTGGTPSQRVRAFAIAGLLNGQSVQRALAESSTRAAAGDPALADLVRREQNARREIAALAGTLSNLLGAPADQRIGTIIAAQRARIAELGLAREALNDEIRSRFPKYSELVAPTRVDAEEARALLRPDEALIVIHSGEERTHVWAVTHAGEIAFATVEARAADLRRGVARLRRALDPGEIVRLGDIPEFDVAAALELYRKLLAPVEIGWKSAASLLVVPGRVLGQLPMSLLVTRPAPPIAPVETLFAEYASIQWLARTHAVTVLPSIASLKSLRSATNPGASRRPFVGFGDPYFNAEQAAEGSMRTDTNAAAAALRSRDAPIRLRNTPATRAVDSADLALLPRLPETALELSEIARALGADPVADVNTGLDATEERVKTMGLDGFKVVAFATHGLVPGDLNGLDQPALALTSPTVSGTGGDGLLTMSEILGLRMDADWVVLSACNTAAAGGQGAEAVSGLGLAFFYAGSRALLVSNWPVHSGATVALTTALFREQAANPATGRAEALRLAMLSLIDGPGFVDGGGRRVFSYAHPIFWAPFTIVGDGGGGRPAS